MLTLHKPDDSECNISNQLTNVLLGIWPPLIQILDGVRPNSISTFDSCDTFAVKYLEGIVDPESFTQFVQELMDNRMKSESKTT